MCVGVYKIFSLCLKYGKNKILDFFFFMIFAGNTGKLKVTFFDTFNRKLKKNVFGKIVEEKSLQKISPKKKTSSVFLKLN